MNSATKFRIYRIGLAIALLSVPAFGAQQPKQAVAPVPVQIVSAKTVFISNAGGDSVLFPDEFSGTPDRVYNQFYETMKSWGRYELVTAPAEADLVFEIRLIAPNGGVSVVNGVGNSWTDPQFRLVILDPKTHVGLWTFIEHIQRADTHARPKSINQAISIYKADIKNRDNNFDEAMASLVSGAKKLTTQLTTDGPNK
ncbi:MAG TPA: hypothetical protein VGJ06_16725 [Candidatus Acidoferrum sp.]|jgi:hypothetical protein